MNTMLLRYALEVERTGSITRAAANLYMDQPNLSKAIKSLEESLGAPVFKRTPKGMIPTEKGRIFLEYAGNVLVQIEEMERLYQPERSNDGEFSLFMPGSFYLNLAFSRFVSKGLSGKMGDVRIREGGNQEVLTGVETGEYRLGILRFPSCLESFWERDLAERGLMGEVLLEYEEGVLMSEKHPLAGKKGVLAEDLPGYVEVVCGNENAGVGEEWERRKNGKIGEGIGERTGRVCVSGWSCGIWLLGEIEGAYMREAPVFGDIPKKYGAVWKDCGEEGEKRRDVLVWKKGYVFSKEDNVFLDEVKLLAGGS